MHTAGLQRVKQNSLKRANFRTVGRLLTKMRVLTPKIRNIFYMRTTNNNAKGDCKSTTLFGRISNSAEQGKSVGARILYLETLQPGFQFEQHFDVILERGTHAPAVTARGIYMD